MDSQAQQNAATVEDSLERGYKREGEDGINPHFRSLVTIVYV
jgi:hypothetical protein